MAEGGRVPAIAQHGPCKAADRGHPASYGSGVKSSRARRVPREENRKPAPVWQNRCGSNARSPVTVGGPTGPSAQELKYECGRLIRLGKHRDSGLLKNLRADKLTHA
ncbi:hypothetical protein LBMAG38_08660 [Chloroflexota bacterium]|nr:hypothetical protein LBMAG38_08660 [Chloroflexota bacterium]